MEIIEDLKSQISFFGFEMTDTDSLIALDKGEQNFVLFWAKDGFVLFETSKEGVWRANRPIVIPSNRIQKVSFEKRQLMKLSKKDGIKIIPEEKKVSFVDDIKNF